MGKWEMREKECLVGWDKDMREAVGLEAGGNWEVQAHQEEVLAGRYCTGRGGHSKYPPTGSPGTLLIPKVKRI